MIKWIFYSLFYTEKILAFNRFLSLRQK